MLNKDMLLEVAEKGSNLYFDEQMSVLEKFSGIDCQSRNIEGNKKVVEIIKQVLDTMDVEVEEHFGEGIGTHIVARIKPENPTGKIIVSAHSDTQPGFQNGDTQKYPFHIEGDWAYGLGICDCKAGLVSSMYSVKIMQEAGLLPNKEIVMIYNCDEEIGSISSRTIFEKEAKNADMTFVFEPSRDDNGIIVDRKGIAVFELKITGKTAHFCVAHKDGRSASTELAHQTVRLVDEFSDYENILYDVSCMYSNRGMSDEASARVVASLQTDKGIKMFHEHIKEIEAGKTFVDGCKCSVDVQIEHPNMAKNDSIENIFNLVNKAGKIMGIDYPEQISTGSGDACLFNHYGSPAVDAMGPYMKDIHTHNERLFMPSLKERTKLFALVLGIME